MKPSEFFNKLLHHDWHHEMSDDASVYRAGKLEEEALKRIADATPLFKSMWDTWIIWRNRAGNPDKVAIPSLTDFNIGDDEDVEMIPVRAPNTKEAISQWRDFRENALAVAKQNYLPFDFDILSFNDAQLDNYIQRRGNDYLTVVEKFVAARLDADNVTLHLYGRKFFCRSGVYSTYLGTGVLYTFRNVQQMLCWVLKLHW